MRPLVKKLDFYLFKGLLAPFFFGMLGAMVITSFGPLLKAIKLLTRGKVPAAVVLRWFVLRLPQDMQYIFPVAMLLASLLVFGKLSKQSEITAMRAAGISLGRLMAPVVAFSLLVSVGVFFFLDRVVPYALRESRKIWERDIRMYTSSRYVYDVLRKEGDARLLYVGRYDPVRKRIERVVLREYSGNRTPSRQRSSLILEITALSGVFVSMVETASGRKSYLWRLSDVNFRAYEGTAPPKTSWAASYDLLLEDGPEDLKRKDEVRPGELSCRELVEEIRYLEGRGLADTRALKVELYLKTSFPVCIVIFAVLGASMGLSSSRSGAFIGFGVSLVVTFLYYLAMSISASLGKTGVLDPLLAAWLHNLVFLGCAVWNVYRVQRR